MAGTTAGWPTGRPERHAESGDLRLTVLHVETRKRGSWNRGDTPERTSRVKTHIAV